MPVTPYMIEKFGLRDWIVVESNLSFQAALALLSKKGISLSRAFLIEQTVEGTYRAASFVKLIQTLSDADPIWINLPIGQLPLNQVGRIVQVNGNETSRSLVDWISNHSGEFLIALHGEDVEAILTSGTLSANESIVGDVLLGGLHGDTISLAGNPFAKPINKAKVPICPVCHYQGYYEFNTTNREFLCQNPDCRHIVKKI